MKLGTFEWMLPGYFKEILAKCKDINIEWYLYAIILKKYVYHFEAKYSFVEESNAFGH